MKVNKLEYGFLGNGLIELINKLLREKEDTTTIDELLLKLVDNKNLLRKHSHDL